MKKAIGSLFVLMAICTACAPQVTITAPENGDTFNEGELIVFKCDATDREDGNLSGESVVWYADSEELTLGTGTEMQTDTISRGEHTIIVIATDSDGKTGTDEITITIGQGGASTTTTSVAAPSSATIGQSGGTVATGKARLVIPAGALENDVKVSIAEVAGMDRLIGPAYDLQPAGLQFAKPATLIIDYSSGDLPAGSAPDEVAIISLDEHYEPAQDDPSAPLLSSLPYYIETAVDEANTTASAPITHFSRYGFFGPIPTLTATPGATKMIIHPTEETPDAVFDYGNTQTFIVTSDGTGIADAEYSLLFHTIKLRVETFSCEASACGGDVSATCYLAKVFRVKAGQNTQTIPGAVGCTIVDTGGDSTGNCNIGERRVRVMDLGAGKDAGKFVPVQAASASDEWWDMPEAMYGKPPTPHAKTSSQGDDYVLSATFTVDHYYAIVVDLMAVASVNICSGPAICCPSSQVWDWNKFEVTTLLVNF